MSEAADFRKKVMTSHLFEPEEPAPPRRQPDPSPPRPPPPVQRPVDPEPVYESEDSPDQYPSIAYRDTRIHHTRHPDPPPSLNARAIILDPPQRVTPIVLDDAEPLKTLDAFPILKFDVPSIRRDLDVSVRRRAMPQLRAPPTVKMTVAADMASLREKATQHANDFARKMQA